MAKKAPATKPAVKRKPRAKKPVVTAIEQAIREAAAQQWTVPPVTPSMPIAWRSVLLQVLPCLLAFVFGIGAGVWGAGGIDIGPDSAKPDAVSAVFGTQETAFRRLSGERAKALRAGELTTEKASADWMAAKYLPESDAAWATLLTAEAAAFGGEKWTAEKEATTVGGYAR